MRRNVDAPEVVWSALSLLTEKLGYKSRQELTEVVLTNFVNSYPGVMLLAADEAFQKMDAAEAKKDFEYVRTIPKPTKQELEELWGGEITDTVVMNMPSFVPVDVREQQETPELPEL